MGRRGAAAARYGLAAAQDAYREAVASEQGWQAAVRLCQHLAAGDPPLTVGSSPEGEPVLLDAVFDCFSWFGVDVVPDQRPVVAFGSPLFVTAAVAVGAAANRRARAHAEAWSRPRWHAHGRVQVLVSAAATWCGRGGQWRCYRHSTVAEYQVVQGGASMRFTCALAPVRLVGPAVWCHAVLLACAQYGPQAYLQAPYLERLRHMALQFPVPVG